MNFFHLKSAGQQLETKDIVIIFSIVVVLILFLFIIMKDENEKIQKNKKESIAKRETINPENIIEACISYVYQQVYSNQPTEIKILLFEWNKEIPAMNTNELIDFIIKKGKANAVAKLIPDSVLEEFSVFLNNKPSDKKEKKDDKITEDGKKDSA